MIAGVDIGSGSVKVAVLKPGRKGPRLVSYAEERLPEPQEGRTPDQALVQTLRSLVDDGRLPRGDTVCAVAAQDCLVRDITVPFDRDEQIRRTIKFQAESFYYAGPIEDTIVDFHRIQSSDGKSRVLLAVCRKDVVGRLLTSFGEVGLDPVSVDLDMIGLYNAALASGSLADKGVSLVVDVGSRFLRILLAVDRRLHMVRSLRIRDTGALAAIQASMPVPLEVEAQEGDAGEDEDAGYSTKLLEAASGESGEWDLLAQIESGRLPVVVIDDDEEDLLDAESPDMESEQGAGAAPDDSGGGPLAGFFRRVALETERTVSAAFTEEPLGALVLTGGGSTLPGLREFLEDRFEAPARPLRLDRVLGGLAGDMAERVSSRGATAVGLALKGLGWAGKGAAPVALEFRRENYAFQRRFDKLKSGLAATSCLLFLLSYLMGSYFHIEADRLQSRLDKQVYPRQQALYHALFPGEDMPHPVSITRSLETRRQQLQESIGQIRDIPEVVNSLEILRRVCLAMNAARLPELQFSQISIKQRESVITMVSPVQFAHGPILTHLEKGDNPRLKAVLDKYSPNENPVRLSFKVQVVEEGEE